MKEYKVFYMKDNEDLADILDKYATIKEVKKGGN